MANPSAFGEEMANKKIKRHKAPGVDQIPAYFINPYPANVENNVSS
jgi:hypothetical protein